MADTTADSAQAVHPLTLLDALTPEARAELLGIAQPVSFMRGAVLLKQGAPTRGAFFIQSGSVDVTARLPGGDTLNLARIPAGGVLGEMALLEHGLCSATVTASTPVDGLFIGREDFRVLVARRSPASLAVQQAITRNLCAKLSILNAQVLANSAAEDVPYTTPPADDIHETMLPDPLAARPRVRHADFDYRRFLSVLPLFREWEPEEIDEIADLAPALQLERGQPIFFEGAEAKAMFITVRGAVEVMAPATADTAGTATPMLRRLAILGPGQLLGHRSLIDGTRHAARARAREETVVLELTREHFLLLYNCSTPAALKFQAGVHAALLGSMAHTNATLTRLINMARVRAAGTAALEAALAEQAVYAS